MTDTTFIEDDTRDNAADEVIQACLSLKKPQSFFLYAGAGSGKTRSLKDALHFVLKRYGDTFRRQGRKVGVITYTNAACNEILRRVKHDPIFDVATIHSFAWTLLEGRTRDISQWLAEKLPQDIEDSVGMLGRARTKKSRNTLQHKITSLEKRLKALESIIQFTYNPNGDNFGRDSLSHNEVIAMSSDFLTREPTLQKIVLSRYPFLLIDESQDTLQQFMEALLKFEKAHEGQIVIGLFGDTMQRIYGHGKSDLTESIPACWKKPEKCMNHRSRERIIRLANVIREDADGWSQRARADKSGGNVAAYIVPVTTDEKSGLEDRICRDLAERTGDPDWTDVKKVKMLMVEHHMAAERLGFKTLFSAIDPVSTLKTGFRDGSLAELRFFTEQISPLVNAYQEGSRYAVMAILRSQSPLLSKTRLQLKNEAIETSMKIVQRAVSALMAHFKDSNDPRCIDILSTVKASGLLTIPEDLLMALDLRDDASTESFDDIKDVEVAAWQKLLDVRFSEIPLYKDYVNDHSRFGTHQGVKGLEFRRVMVITDDASMRFKGSVSYGKLFGDKPPSKTDIANESAGKETMKDRTRRLLYVTCTRAKESLALVIYSDKPNLIKKTLLSREWFMEDEINTSVH